MSGKRPAYERKETHPKRTSSRLDLKINYLKRPTDANERNMLVKEAYGHEQIL
jgi:hypothetical protein